MTQVSYGASNGKARRWSTETFDSQSKMTKWSDIVCEHMTELAVTTDRPDAFVASWIQHTLGTIDLNFVEASAQHVYRSPEMVMNAGSSTFELVYMRHGEMILQRGQKRHRVGEGDFVLLRNCEPYEFVCSTASSGLSTHIPNDWLVKWLPAPERLQSMSEKVRRSWGKPLAGLLIAVAESGLDDVGVPRRVIEDQIGSLLGVMCTAEEQKTGRAHADLLARARTILRQTYSDIMLDPTALAKEVGVSKRMLHSLFAEVGTTFGAELMEIRLAEAARKLVEYRYRDRPIGDVAWAAGFADASHFSRRFRARFHCSPRLYRQNL